MEYNPSKIFWFAYFFLSIIAMGWGYIGAEPAQRMSILFYEGILALPGLVIVLFDWATPDRPTAFQEIDTITIEEPHEGLKWFGLNQQLILGVILAGLVFWKIAVTSVAFVDAPIWGIFDSPLGNAAYSALVGLRENLAFFGVIMPVGIAISSRYTGEKLIAIGLGFLIATSAFTIYHTWRYGYDELAMRSVTVFGLIGCITTFGSNSLIIIDLIHASNNLAIALGYSKRIGLAILL